MSNCPAITVADSAGSMPASPGLLPQLQASIVHVWLRLAWLLSAGQRLTVAVLGSVWMLLACKAVIGVVSAFDTYLTIKYAESLDIYEQNPLGRWLMGLDQGPICETQQVAAFITAKFLGTLLAMIAIQGLAYWRVRVAILVATPLACGQLYLALHLLFGDG